jgi:hypothetical protein
MSDTAVIDESEVINRGRMMASRLDVNLLTPGRRMAAVGAALLLLGMMGGAWAVAQTPQITPPKPTVSEIFSLEGQWVRIAYNNEGYASLGYRYAQQQIGQDWMLLTVGITVRKPAPNYKLVRAKLSITTPDGKRIALPTQQEYRGANLMALNMRAQSINDSINYYPPDANQPCAIKFFADPNSAFPLSYDQVELSWQRVCMGRLYFKVPGGVQVGQHFLNIKFANSEVQVPFRTVSKEDEKILSKKWEEIQKEINASQK